MWLPVLVSVSLLVPTTKSMKALSPIEMVKERLESSALEVCFYVLHECCGPVTITLYSVTSRTSRRYYECELQEGG